MPKGENYGSDLLRVHVKISDCADESAQHEEIALIVKNKLSEEMEAAALIDEMNCFGIEADAYQIVLPRVHKLLQSIGDDTRLAPKWVVLIILHKQLVRMHSN